MPVWKKLVSRKQSAGIRNLFFRGDGSGFCWGNHIGDGCGENLSFLLVGLFKAAITYNPLYIHSYKYWLFRFDRDLYE